MATSSPRFENKSDDKTRTLNEPVQQAAQATQDAAGTAAEQTSRAAETAARAAAGVSDRTMRAGADMARRNAETVHHAIQSGAQMAARMTERSADHFGRAMGISGEEAQHAARKSSGNIEALVQSTTVMSEISQQMMGEWVNFARESMERNFDRMDTLLKCRTPQDVAALQSELLRDHVACLLGYGRRVGEHSMRMADEASKKLGDAVEGRAA